MKTIKKNKTIVITLIVLTMLNVLLVTYQVIEVKRMVPKYSESLDIVYDELTLEQKNISKSLIDDIPRHFYAMTNKITFTSSKSACEDDIFETIGCYDPNTREIIVEWDNSSNIQVAETLCHELIHSFFYYPRGDIFIDDVHTTINYLGEKYSCYEDKSLINKEDK